MDLLKLYKLDAEPKRYWETWNRDGVQIVHWGELGTRGQTEEVLGKFLRPASSIAKKISRERLAEGFRPVPDEDHRILLIEFPVDGFGAREDLEKRYRLEDRIDQTLGWTGLGHCDGGSSGQGTMEVCCFVVDFALAKDVIENDLRETEFSNFSRIYDEVAEFDALEKP